VAPKQSSKVGKVAKGKAVKKKKRFLIAYGCPEFGVRGKVCDDDDDGALLPPTVVPIPSQVGSNDDSLKKIITASCSTVMLIGNSVYTCGEEPLGRDLTTTDLVAVNTRLTEIDARVRDLIEDGKYSLVKSYLKIPYRRAGLGDSDEPVIHAKLFLDKLDANTIGSDKHLQEVESLVGEANKLTQQKLELDAAEEDGGATPALVSFINSEGVDESHSITTIAGGTNFVVALSKDGTVFFFGKMKFDDTDWCYIDKENGMSVFADGNNLTPIELVLPSSKAKAINLFAGPEYFYIHLEDGTLLSAGFGAHGQLLRKGAFSKDDTGTVDFGTNAGPPAPKYDVKKVHDALIPDICNPTFVNMAGRAQRMTGGKIAKVAAGKDHCLMLWEKFVGDKRQTRLFVMGLNENGQLGVGQGQSSVSNALVQLSFFDQMVISDIACGDNHSLVLVEGGKLFSFGANDAGQLGLPPHETNETFTCATGVPGETTMRQAPQRSRPARVAFASAKKVVKLIAAGQKTSLAVTGTPTAHTMGDSEATGLDLDSPTRGPIELDFNTAVPLKGHSIKRFVDITAGIDHGGVIVETEAIFDGRTKTP